MIPQTEPFILFLRHAERVPIPADDPYADVDLTPVGYAETSDLARRLGHRLSWAAASPFRRCVATARGLFRDAEDDTRLGRHGPWIVDPDAAGQAFAQRGIEGVVRAQIAGVPLPGIRSAEEAVPILLASGLDRIHRGSGVCISHDAVLMPAMAFLFGPEACERWLAPLDGFAITMHEGGPLASWKGKARRC